MNRGKPFESKFREQAEKVFDLTRLKDSTVGFRGDANVCDFMAYKYPYLYYLELKTTKENTLPFANITQTQWEGLIQKEKIEGVGAGLVIWYQKHDLTFFVSAGYMNKHKQLGFKSFNVKDLIKDSQDIHTKLYHQCFELKGVKKKVYFDYNMEKFLSSLEEYVHYGK